MLYPKIPLAQTVVQLCKAKGIAHIVISPGSRNAPLTIGFTEDGFFNCYSIVDERSAGFFALGIAQNLRRPVAVVCTSGSALLNYYPAVAEAFYSDIPLVVLSADRPKHLVGIGDGQTINQKHVYENHILYSANLKLDLKDEKNIPEDEELPIMKSLEDKFERFLGLQKDIQVHNETELNNALNHAVFHNGPVHVNVPFEEPLYETVSEPTIKPKVLKVEERPKKVDSVELKACLEDWKNATRKMVLVGVNPPNSVEQQWLDELASDNSVLVFTETTSNLHHKGFFPHIDKIIAPLTEDDFKALQPDILLTFGGMVVSKKVKAFLRKYKPKQHWHVDLKKANDTFFCLERHIQATPNRFFADFLPQLTHLIKSDYKDRWKAVRKTRKKQHAEYLKTCQFSDFTVINTVLKNLPKHSALQVSNRSAIRYTQLFGVPKIVEVFCNRGTSGIDGSSSTAVGFSVVSDKPTTLLTGDLSFFYDSNALWNHYIPKDFRIVLINNGGGGIFRILSGNKNTDNFDRYFETKHQIRAKQLCEMYGFEYATAQTEDSLEYALETFFEPSEQPKLLEIITPRVQNDDVLLHYFEFLTKS